MSHHGKTSRRRAALALALPWLCALLPATANAQVPALATRWQLSYAPNGYSLETRAAAVTPEGDLAVLAVQRPLARGKDRGADRGWIGRFGGDGQLRSQFDFALRPGDGAVAEIDSFLPLAEGAYLVTGQAEDGGSWLARVSGEAGPRPVHALGRARAAFVLPLAGGELLLGGRIGRDLFAMQLRSDGKPRWERQLDRGLDDLFLAAAATADGAVLLEHSGVREQFFMRDTTVGVTRLDSTDAGIGAPRFKASGRAGALVASDAGYALLLDGGTGVKQSLRFVRLDAELRPLHEPREVLGVEFALERARLAALGNGQLLLLALDGGKLIGLRLDAAGTPVARLDSDAGRVFLHPDVQAAAGQAYLVATELKTRDDQRGARSQVYVARLALPAP